MITAEFEKLVNQQFQHCYNILFEKAKQYNIGTEDRLHAFKVAASFQGITNEQALLGMLTKHFVSLSDMIRSNNKYSMEMWDEKITDSINYLLLLKALKTEALAIDDKKE